VLSTVSQYPSVPPPTPKIVARRYTVCTSAGRPGYPCFCTCVEHTLRSPILSAAKHHPCRHLHRLFASLSYCCWCWLRFCWGFCLFFWTTPVQLAGGLILLHRARANWETIIRSLHLFLSGDEFAPMITSPESSLQPQKDHRHSTQICPPPALLVFLPRYPSHVNNRL
jgi:hypothetical protein